MGFNNGVVNAVNGCRSVLLSPEGDIRPVAFTIESGELSQRGTVQVDPCVGDFIMTITWNRVTSSICHDLVVVTQVKGSRYETGPVKNDIMLIDRFYKQHPWFDDFFNIVQGPCGSWIPKWVYKETLANIAKRSRCVSFLHQFGLRFSYTDDWEFTSKRFLNLKPRPLDFNPDKYKFFVFPYQLNHVAKRELFFSSRGDYSDATAIKVVALETVDHNSIDYLSPRRAIGLQDWDRNQYLVRLVFNAHLRDDSRYGVTVDVWDLKAKSILGGFN